MPSAAQPFTSATTICSSSRSTMSTSSPASRSSTRTTSSRDEWRGSADGRQGCWWHASHRYGEGFDAYPGIEASNGWLGWGDAHTRGHGDNAFATNLTTPTRLTDGTLVVESFPPPGRRRRRSSISR